MSLKTYQVIPYRQRIDGKCYASIWSLWIRWLILYAMWVHTWHLYLLELWNMHKRVYLLASSSRSLTSNSLLGGYFGKLAGSQGNGFVVKNWTAEFTIFWEWTPNEINNGCKKAIYNKGCINKCASKYFQTFDQSCNLRIQELLNAWKYSNPRTNLWRKGIHITGATNMWNFKGLDITSSFSHLEPLIIRSRMPPRSALFSTLCLGYGNFWFSKFVLLHFKISCEKPNSNTLGNNFLKITSLPSAEAAVPRCSGSIVRRTSIRAKAEEGKSLNVSATQRL